MDPALLGNPDFWADPRPVAPAGFDGEIPGISELENHLLFQTSGSSGRPKWIALSKNALLLSAACVNRHLGVTADSRWGLALPIHHVGGFGVAARAYEAAAEFLAFHERWEPVVFSNWLLKMAITHTSLVPTQVYDLVAAKLRAPSSITAIVVGGGRLDLTTGQAARDLGWPVLASYGMTEACSQIATQSPDLLDSPYQAEGIPLLQIWKARHGGEQRLQISGPALFSGTLEQNDGVWNYARRTSAWFETSDRVVLENGKVSPLGRADSVVKILGELVDPESIERELMEISGRQLQPGSFVVVAVPDPRAGHRLVPVFEQSVDRKLICSTLENHHIRVPGFRRLQPAVFIRKIPHSPLGKPLRAEIRKFFEA